MMDTKGWADWEMGTEREFIVIKWDLQIGKFLIEWANSPHPILYESQKSYSIPVFHVVYAMN